MIIINTSFHVLDEPLTAFSLLKNAKSLLSMKRETGDISTLHGIRFVNAFLLLMSHKSMAMFFNPYANRTEMIEVFLLKEKTDKKKKKTRRNEIILIFNTILIRYSEIMYRFLVGQLPSTPMHSYWWVAYWRHIQLLEDCSASNRHAYFKNILDVFCVLCPLSVLSYCFVHIFCQIWDQDRNGIWWLTNMRKFAKKLGGEIYFSSIIISVLIKW